MNEIPTSSPQPPQSEPPTTEEKDTMKQVRVWTRFAVNVTKYLFETSIKMAFGSLPANAAIDKRSIEHVTSNENSDKAFTLAKASQYERDGQFTKAAWLRSQASEGIYESSTGEWHHFRRLGRGGEGCTDLVFKGLAGELEVKKTFHKPGPNQASEEIKLLERLDHPNIMKIFHRKRDNGEQEQGIHMNNGGVTLESIVPPRNNPPPVPRQLFQSIAKQLADSLAYLKEEQVLHRDIKPANIVIDPTGHITLIDFGIAYDCITNTPCHPRAKGTPRFMPPDTLNDDDIKYSDTADMFATGQTLFQLLTGNVLTFPNFWLDDQETETETEAWDRYKRDPITLASLEVIDKKLTNILEGEDPAYVGAVTDMLKKMLHPDPEQRITPKQLKEHRLFTM